MLKFSIRALPSDDADSATFTFFVEGSSVVVTCTPLYGPLSRAEIPHSDFKRMANFLAEGE